MSSFLTEAALPVAILGSLLGVFLYADLRLFGRGGETTREAAVWSVGWLVLSLLAALVLWPLEGGQAAVDYTTVYLIERSLSLDNVFVFLLLFTYFGIPAERRPALILWGVIAALVMRGGAIAGGVAVIEEFEAVLYVLGALLILLAIRVYRGVEENADPDRNLMIRVVRRFFPVAQDDMSGKWFVRRGEGRHVTPIFLCLAGMVFADIAFAIDSIPAAFAITREPLVIWMGNVFALLGLRALFVLVDRLIDRFRYLDETIAVVLALVGLKILLEEVVHLGSIASLAMVALAFAIGIAASLIADRRESV